MTNTLLAVATPMHMIAPVSAGTDNVVPVANKVQTLTAAHLTPTVETHTYSNGDVYPMIPTCITHDIAAHCLVVMDAMRSGVAMRSLHAWQQAVTTAS